jgi:sortase A
VSFTTIRMGVGRVLLVAGVLVLLFIPYLLWGTGLKTAHSQSLLRAQFIVEQHKAGDAPVTKPVSPTKKPSTAPQVAPTVADPPIGSPVGTIDIPKIGLNMMVVEGTDETRLQEGPGHYPGTPLPGEAGNAAIAGHRTTYLHPFYSLDQLNPGDPIVVTTAQGSFDYQVLRSEVVLPTDVAVVDPTPTPQLTLTTCNPRYSASQRLVVHAALVSSVLTHPIAPVAAVTSPKPGPADDQPQPPASSKDWAEAIVWGVVVAGLITAVWIGARMTRRWTRALILAGGLVLWLGVVFMFFQSLAPLLPASY